MKKEMAKATSGAVAVQRASTLFMSLAAKGVRSTATTPEGAATSPAQLANRRAFLDRLNSAVEQQCQTVDRNREKVEMERSRLLLASRDKQVLEQLAASYRAQERQAADRRSQREMDDLGARLARPSLGAANEDKEQQR